MSHRSCAFGVTLSFALLILGGLALASRARAVLPSNCAQSGQTVTCTFGYTGAEQVFSVPTGISSVSIAAVGAPGSGASAPAGAGGTASTTLPVSAGRTLYVEVGGPGDPFTTNSGAGGWNGGGAGNSYGDASGGGGASDVRTVACGTTCPGSSASLASRLLVAGGGGGGGFYGIDANTGASYAGGAGGAAGGAGGNGQPDGHGDGGGGGGAPGTLASGGSGGTGATGGGINGTVGQSGTLGQGGAGASIANGGSGGGGGYYGGGGGGGGAVSVAGGGGGGGGGGGSSYAPGGSIGVASLSAAPRVTISYTVAATPGGGTPAPRAPARVRPHLRLRLIRARPARAGCVTELNEASTASLTDRQCTTAIMRFSGTIDRRADGGTLTITLRAKFGGRRHTIHARTRIRGGRFSFTLRLPGRNHEPGDRWKLTIAFAGNRTLRPTTLTRTFLLEAEHG